MGSNHHSLPKRKRAGYMGGRQQQDYDHRWHELPNRHHRQEPRHLYCRRHSSSDLPVARLLCNNLCHEQLQHQQRRLDELRHAKCTPACHSGTDAKRGAGRYQGSEQADLGGKPEQHHQHHGRQAVPAFRNRDFRQHNLLQERRGKPVRLLLRRKQQGQKLVWLSELLVGALALWQRLDLLLSCRQQRHRRHQLRVLLAWRGLRLLLLIQTKG